jgi:hypothetical protein
LKLKIVEVISHYVSLVYLQKATRKIICKRDTIDAV